MVNLHEHVIVCFCLAPSVAVIHMLSMVGRAFRLSWDSTMSCAHVHSTMACAHVDATMHRVASARRLGGAGLVGRNGGRLFVCRSSSRRAAWASPAACRRLGCGSRSCASQSAENESSSATRKVEGAGKLLMSDDSCENTRGAFRPRG